MTTDSDFKRLVRDRMRRTGERYTTARAALEIVQPTPASSPEQACYDRVVRTFFTGTRLRSIPHRRRARVVVLLELLRRFERERSYTESEGPTVWRRHPPGGRIVRDLLDSQLGTVWRFATECVIATIEPEVSPAQHAWSVDAHGIQRIRSEWDAALTSADLDAPVQWLLPDPVPVWRVAGWVPIELMKNLAEIHQLLVRRRSLPTR